MKKIFNLIGLLIFTVIFGVSNISSAKEYLIEASGDYFIDLRIDETFASAVAQARKEAQRSAAEKAGVYVKSYSKTVDLRLDTDEVQTIAAQLIKVQDEEVTSEPAGKNMLRIIVNVKATVDDEINDETLKALMNDRPQLEEATQQYVELQKQYEELKKQNDALKKQLNNSNAAQTDKINKAVAQNNQYFEAMQALEEGNNFYIRKEYQQAVSSYTRAININPDYDYAYNNRGNAYVELGQYQNALQDLQRAVKMMGADARTHNNLGGVYLLLKRYDEAVSEYTQALNLDPNQAATYYNRALAYFYQGEYQNALSDAKRALELNPNDADTKTLYNHIVRRLK